MRGGLEDLSVSRTTFTWGVPVPGDPEHVMYVWFDALSNYYTPMLGHAGATARVLARASRAPRRQGHPALSRGVLAGVPDVARACPRPAAAQVFAHGFLTVNGQKMCKIAPQHRQARSRSPMPFGVDTLRYYLMRAIAFGQDGDFNVKDLLARYNADLGNALGNLLNRVLKRSRSWTQGTSRRRASSRISRRALRLSCRPRREAAADAFDAVQPHRALEAIWQVIGAANQYIDRAAPWAASKRGDTLRTGTILGDRAHVLEAVSTMIWPVMPSSADALRAQLGLPKSRPRWAASVGRSRSPPGKLAKRWALRRRSFPRIDPDQEKSPGGRPWARSRWRSKPQEAKPLRFRSRRRPRRVPSPTTTSRKSISG